MIVRPEYHVFNGGKKMRLLFAAVLSCLAVGASAATPNYYYERTIDFLPHPTIGALNFLAPDNIGGVYATSHFNDSVYYISDVLNVVPDDTDPNTLVPTVASDQEGIIFDTGNSFRGVTFDGVRAFAGGRLNNGNGLSSFLRLTPNNPLAPSDWTIERQDINGSFGGPTAVGPNLLALPDFLTGAVSIWEWGAAGGGALTQVTAPVAGSGLAGKSTDFDPVTNRIYVATSDETLSGRVDYFNYNPVTRVVTYGGVFTPGVAATGTPPANGISYPQVSVEPTDQVLLTSHMTGTAETTGYALYDASATLPNTTPYSFFNMPPDPPATPPTANSKTAATFGTSGTTKYMILSDQANKLYLYTQPTANIADWTIY
jgi:hypothetical protein